MFNHLQIYDARERTVVGCADIALSGYGAVSRWSRTRATDAPRRILLLRLERIGDLLMTLGALDAVRARAPHADIHLVVGSWNRSLAEGLQSIDSWETLDVPWLARRSAGSGRGAMLRSAWAWRDRGFDLAINFEPDIRSNLLLGLSGAPRRVGFSSGGGRAFLTDALIFNPDIHTAANALRLVDAALAAVAGAPPPARFPQMPVTEAGRAAANGLLGNANGGGLLVGLHASGGRPVKQWHLDRFAEVATRLTRAHGATVVLTGALDDRPVVDAVKAALPPDVVPLDVAGSVELPVLAALLERLRLFVTADTGPMHLAAAVGTPVVALFGPSGPNRYGPLTDHSRIVAADLWCRPCNRVRRPPERCQGRVPDCLDFIDVDDVLRAAEELLNER